MTSSYRDPHPHTGALRAQIGGIIHRHNHAKFHVKMIIHQLNSVPLVEGEFAVRWKFRGVVKQTQSQKEKGKMKEKEDGVSSITGTPIRTSPNQSMESLPHSSSDSSHSNTNSHAHSQASTAHSSATHIPSQDSLGEPINYSSTDRGTTDYLPLSAHKVVYEHQVDVVLQMYVTPPGSSSSATSSRPQSPIKKPPNSSSSSSHSNVSTPSHSSSPKRPPLRLREDSSYSNAGQLLSSPLKLVVTQRRVKASKTDEQGAAPPPNPRLGAVYLDLAEYADASLGPVSRKYLLMESKTNAILVLTIQLTALSSPSTGFVAPPLRSSTIQSSLTSLQPSFTHLPSFHHSNPGSGASTPSKLSPTPRKLPPLAPKLGTIESAEETEALIEALFNPFVTIEELEAKGAPPPPPSNSQRTVRPEPSPHQPRHQPPHSAEWVDEEETPHPMYSSFTSTTSGSATVMQSSSTTTRSTSVETSLTSLRSRTSSTSTPTNSRLKGQQQQQQQGPGRTFSSFSTSTTASVATTTSSSSSRGSSFL